MGLNPLPQHVPCRLHHRIFQNRIDPVDFASARTMQVASSRAADDVIQQLLCLSTYHAGCILQEGYFLWHLPIFASARTMQVASWTKPNICTKTASLPQHVPCRLHRLQAGIILMQRALPQHVPCRLHPCQRRGFCQHDALPQHVPCRLHRRIVPKTISLYCALCCE